MKKYTQEGIDLPELSLAPNSTSNSSSSEAEVNLPMKRKFYSDNLCMKTDQTSVDLQLKDPLPLDWEQCLDLRSGSMYYLNRKTLRKSLNSPNDEKLDLELNISSSGASSEMQPQESYKKQQLSSSSESTSMVALACLSCHLLVILSKSSPTCPNCKYVHSLETPEQITTNKVSSATIKTLNTLSLLN